VHVSALEWLIIATTVMAALTGVAAILRAAA
jgi:hypothetical protein